jgi:hypothetical protein
MLENATGTVTDSTSVEDETVEAAPQEAMDDIIDNFTLDDLKMENPEDESPLNIGPPIVETYFSHDQN